MSQNLRIKGGTTGEAFQERCFLWEKGTPVGADFDLFYFQNLLHAQEPIWNMKERKQAKKSPLNNKYLNKHVMFM